MSSGKIGYISLDFEANVVKFLSDIGKASKGMEQTQKQIGAAVNKINASLSSIGKGATVVAAFVGISASVNRFVEESKQAESASKRLDAVLKNTGGSAGISAQAVDQLAQAKSRLTGVDDDLIKNAGATLLMFKKIKKEAFEPAIQASLDLAAAMGGDLNAGAIKVGKIFENPKAAMGALSKEGVVFTTQQQKVIDKLADTGKTAEASARVMEVLQSKVGGLAAAARDSLDGALKALDTSFGNLLAAMFDGAGGMSGLRFAVEGAIIIIEELTAALPDMQKQISAMLQPVIALGEEGFGYLKGAINFCIGTFNLLSESVHLVIEDFSFLGTAIQQSFNGIVQSFGFIGKALGEVANFFGAGGLVKGVTDFAENARKGLEHAFEPITKHFQKDYVGDALKGATKPFNDFANKVNSRMAELAKNAKATGKGIGQDLGQGISDLAEKHEKDLEALKKIVDSLRAQVELEKAITAGDKDRIATLQAEQKIAGLTYLSAAEKALATKEIAGLEKLITAEKEKQKKAEEAAAKARKEKEQYEADVQSLKEMTAEMEYQLKLKKAENSADAETIIQLEAQERVKKLFPGHEKEHADALAKVTEELRKQHQYDSTQAQDQRIAGIKEETAALQAKLEGKELEFELQRKTNELLKDPYLSPEQKVKEVNLLEAQLRRREQINEQIKNQSEFLSKIESGTQNYKQKVEELDKALKDHLITQKQFDDTLKNLNNNTLKNVNQGVKNFTGNISNSLLDAIANGQKLTDVFKQMGIQLAKLGVQKFLIQPLSAKAGSIAQNFFKNNVLPTSPGVASTGGGILGSLLRKIYGTNKGIAPGGFGAVSGSPQSPIVSGQPNPALLAGGQAAGPLGLTPAIAATKNLDNLSTIANTFSMVKTFTPDGPAIRVDIARKELPKGFGSGSSKATASSNDPSNIIPFLKTLVGTSSQGPAWKVIEPDCPCPGGGKLIPFPTGGRSGGTGTASGTDASGDYNYISDQLQPLTALLGLTGLAGILNAFKGGEDVLSPGFLRNLIGRVTDAIEQGVKKITDKMCPCPPPGAEACKCPDIGALLGGLGNLPVGGLPGGISDGGGGSGGGNPLTGGVSGSGGPGYTAGVPQYGTVPPNSVLDLTPNGLPPNSPLLQGKVAYRPNEITPGYFDPSSLAAMSNAFGASYGGFTSTGTVTGTLLGNGGQLRGAYQPTAQQAAIATGAAAAASNAAAAQRQVQMSAMNGMGAGMGTGTLSVAQTQTALNQSSIKSLQKAKLQYDQGLISGSQYLQAQASWDNAKYTLGAMNYRAGVDQAFGPAIQSPFILQGNPYAGGGGGYVDEGSTFRPGLTGAVEGRDMWAPYNYGDYSTQVGGAVGPYFTRDANAATAVMGGGNYQASAQNLIRQNQLSPSERAGAGLTPFSGPFGDSLPPLNQQLIKYWKGLEKNYANPYTNIRGFANGGDPPVGVPSLVGERGQELFIPKERGTILSNPDTRRILNGGGVGATPQVQIINNGHPIQNENQSWDGRKLQVTVKNLVSNAPKQKGFHKSLRSTTGVKQALPRTG